MPEWLLPAVVIGASIAPLLAAGDVLAPGYGPSDTRETPACLGSTGFLIAGGAGEFRAGGFGDRRVPRPVLEGTSGCWSDGSAASPGSQRIFDTFVPKFDPYLMRTEL